MTEAPLDPKPHHGAFLSLLDWLGRPGNSVRNLISGHPGAAGRSLVDFASGPIRAVIPGDQSNWTMERPGDEVHASDLLGMNRQDHPVASAATDIVGDFLTDPLALIGFGELGAAAKGTSALVHGVEGASDVAKAAEAAKAAGEGAEALGAAGSAAKNGGVRLRVPMTDLGTPYIFQGKRVDPLSLVGRGLQKAKTLLPAGAQQSVDNGVLGLKSFFGYLRANPDADAVLAKAAAQRLGVSSLQDAAGQALIKDVPQDLQQRFVDIVDPAEAGADAAYGGKKFVPIDQQVAEWKRRIGSASDLDDSQKEVLSGLADRYGPYIHQMWHEGTTDFKGFVPPEGVEPNASPADYIPRQFKGLDEAGNEFLGSPSAIQSRSLPDAASYADFLQKNPGVERVKDLGALLSNRARQQGTMAERATVGQYLAPDDFKGLADSGSRQAAKDAIERLASSGDKETSMLMDAKFNGLPPQKGIERLVAKTLPYFKSAAVAGAGIPKVASITRNALGHPQQLAMTEGMGGEAIKQLIATPQTMWQGAKSALEKYLDRPIAGDGISEGIQKIRDAAANSGGRFENAVQSLRDGGRPDLADALSNGVVDSGYLHADGSKDMLTGTVIALAKKMGASDGAVDRIGKALQAPSAAFAGSEQYARSRTFDSIYKKAIEDGATADDAAKMAAKAQKDSFYDYGTSTAANRSFRTYIPFGAFTAGSIRQSAGGVSRNPAINDALNPLFGASDTGPVTPYVSDEMRIPLGKGDDGHDKYLSGFAQPIETLGDIPDVFGSNLHDLSRDIQKSVVASSAPVIKSAYGLVTNQDPFFNSPYASYDRVPLIGNAGVAGRIYNAVAGTGAIQPVASLLQTLDRSTDTRDTPFQRLLGSTTGAHVLDVDPAKAEAETIRSQLESDVDAHPSGNYTSSDPETQAVIQAYRDAQAKVRAEKKAAALRPSVL